MKRYLLRLSHFFRKSGNAKGITLWKSERPNQGQRKNPSALVRSIPNAHFLTFSYSKSLFVLVVFIWNSCAPNKDLKKEISFHEKLSSYGFFEGELAKLKPSEDVMAYELNTPLFSDYAEKARFVQVPEGKQIKMEGETLVYPTGTYLIKNFFYWKDEQNKALGRQLIETRLLLKKEDAWVVANYEWNDEQTEAFRNILGGKKEISWIDHQGEVRKVSYVIPDNNDCKSCHKKSGEVTYIGPKARNLNREVLHQGESIHQISLLKQKGWLPDALNIASLSKLPNWSDAEHYSLEQRSRAYLDVNCAHCHSQEGPASNTALFLEYEEQDSHRLGFHKGPVSAAQGSGTLKYNILPGKADSSILVYRMNSVETGVAMPEIGRSLIHEEGVALLQDWINSL